MNLIQSIFLVLLFNFTYNLSAQCLQVIWQDEFDQKSLDERKWSYQTGDGCDQGLCGWGNNELQWYQSDNVEVSDGTMKIIAKKEAVKGKAYSSARIRTIDKADWKYGRFEACIKLPTGKGLWPAFWMLPTKNVYGGWPQSGEIDIVELIGSEPGTTHGTLHYGSPWPQNASNQETYHLHDAIFNDAFHTFAVEWEEGEIRWLIDDYLYATKRPKDLAPHAWPFDQDFHFIFNLAVGGQWPGNPDKTTTFPQSMEVEYVRVYDGFSPSISGQRTVIQNTKATYTLNNVSQGSTITWKAPKGAIITEGQGTSQITLDWAEKGGVIQVHIDNGCSPQDISLNIHVEEPKKEVKKEMNRLFSLENFDDEPKKATYSFTTGGYNKAIKNPSPNTQNASSLVGKYIRKKHNKYDVLVYNVSELNTPAFIDGQQSFFMDIHTDAPIGTEILLQLEDKALSKAPYPKGRHSRFHAFITKQDQWHRLEFTLLDRPDGSVSDLNINQFVFLFAPNSDNADTYYFDNFDVYVPAE